MRTTHSKMHMNVNNIYNPICIAYYILDTIDMQGSIVCKRDEFGLQRPDTRTENWKNVIWANTSKRYRYFFQNIDKGHCWAMRIIMYNHVLTLCII